MWVLAGTRWFTHQWYSMWTVDDFYKSSTYRELKAIFYVCVSYLDQLRQKKVKLFTDNQATARIVSVGSSCPELQAIALQIFGVCLQNHIDLQTKWIPRACNQRADLLSRFIDKDDWSIHPTVFRLLDAKWGPFTIDRFSSYYNFHLLRYNTPDFHPLVAPVWTRSRKTAWSNENNWLSPPVSLIVQTVRKLHSYNGFGTLIIPEWTSGLFWSFLHASVLEFKPYVKGVFILPKFPDLFIEGPGQRVIYRGKTSVFSGCPAFNMLALRQDFRSAA